jgi:hypothetical protein
MALGTWAAALALAEMVPSIFQWIGGSEETSKKSQGFGDIASYVVEIAKRISGASQAEDAINQLRKDKKLFFRFQKHMAELEKELIAAQLKDRMDARNRDLHMVKLGRHNRRADIMVVCASVGLTACLFSLGFYHDSLPGEAVGIISTVAGIFGACLKDAFGFEFGASKQRLHIECSPSENEKKSSSFIRRKMFGKNQKKLYS